MTDNKMKLNFFSKYLGENKMNNLKTIYILGMKNLINPYLYLILNYHFIYGMSSRIEKKNTSTKYLTPLVNENE